MYYQVVPVGAPAPTRTDTVDLSIGTTGGGRDVDFATLVEQVPLVPFAWSRVGGCARVSQSSRVSLRRRSRQSTQRPLNGRRRSETIGVREIADCGDWPGTVTRRGPGADHPTRGEHF